MKNKLKILALLVASLSFAFLLSEVIVRVVSPPYMKVLELSPYIESERGKFTRYDALTGWSGLESAKDDFVWNDAMHPVNHNRFGYRGGEYEHERSGKRRIVFLGDSFLWGFGAKGSELFTSLMERSGDLEAVNLGISGYGTDQEYLLWKNLGHKWKPDDVVLLFNAGNDLWDNLSPVRYNYQKPVFLLGEDGSLELSNTPVPENPSSWLKHKQRVREDDGWFIALLRKSALANMVIFNAARVNTLRELLESKGVIARRIAEITDSEYPIYSKKQTKDVEMSWTVTLKLFDLIKSDVMQNGGRLTIVLVPNIKQVYPELWERFYKRRPKGDANDYEVDAPNNVVKIWGKNNGVKVVDLLPHFKAAGESNPYLYFPINGHWTPEGHMLVADVLTEELGGHDSLASQ